MNKVKIPIIGNPYQSLDGIENMDSTPINIWDAYITSGGYLHRRPGVTEFCDLGTGRVVDGLYYWEEIDRLIAVSKGEVFSLTEAGSASSLGTGLNLATKPTFSNAKISGVDWLAVANGFRILLSQDGGNVQEILDPDAPPQVTHVAFVNNRLVANSVGTDKFYWSSLNNPTSWSALSFASAEGSPDVVTALHNSFGEILLFGTRTIERWYFTGNVDTPFVRRQGSQVKIGTLSPSSIAEDYTTGDFYFFTNDRKVIRYGQSKFDIVSSPLEKQLYEFSEITKIKGDLISINDKQFYVLSSPEDDVTYVFDIKGNVWYQWGKYKSSTATYEKFLGNCGYWSADWGFNFVGSSVTDGKVYKLDTGVYTDDGDEIRSAIRTGWITGNVNSNKNFAKLSMRVKQDPGNPTKFTIYYRKDYQDAFDSGRSREVNVGSGNITPFFHNIHNFGTARALQLEVACSDNCPWVIGDSEFNIVVGRD